MRIRKNWLSLTTTERDTYLQAILTIKNTVANPAAPPAQRYSIYDQFVLIHQAIQNLTTPFSGVPTDGAHGFFHFLPWHRKFLLELENALNIAVPGQNIAIPYWDWTDVAGLWSDILVDAAFGPNGSGAGDVVNSGYFAPVAPATLPAWWPAGLAGWQNMFHSGLGANLIRRIDPAVALPNQATVQDLLLDPDYFAFVDINDVATYTGLWLKLEGGPHGLGHNWFNEAPGFVQAHMSHMYVSVNDPMFFLHHSNVDRLWAMWQMDGHAGAGPYTAPGVLQESNYGHDPAHLLFPWIGGAGGYSSPTSINPGIDFPDFSADPATSINDMLDHRGLGFAYDTEPVVGLALDRTGSMTGVTPDPSTGLPSTLTKWVVASTGVSNFLGDCEAARQAGEAVVTAGVETFRSIGGANEFDKLFVPPFDIVRTGGAVSQANFNAAIAGLSPQGGTPIAGALSDTETMLVRAPYGGNPAGEIRYLYILTDGNETAQPLLGTLANPEFPDTTIFAAGFGVGNGWDGVDYGTIGIITDKGRDAPVGVDQVFHGENVNVVNKFYTNGVAHAIGYDPIIDPYAELNAGEFIAVPFYAGPTERSFMIVANGAPPDEESWSYQLVAPSDDRHDDGNPGHFFITARRAAGRITIFLHRNGTPDREWDGPWYLLVGYKREKFPRDIKELRLGLNAFDPLMPSGASLPLEGPHFSVTKGAIRQKAVPRPILMAPPRPAFTGLRAADKGELAGVTVNIYARTAIPSALWAESETPFSGTQVSWILDLDRHRLSEFAEIGIRAKLIRPDFHIGDAYLDLKTISLDERERFIDKETGIFDEVTFLATYEQRRPGYFRHVEEILEFEQVDGTLFVAKSGQTMYPGTYRAGLAVQGLIIAPHADEGHPLQRIHNGEISLGLKLDDRRSRATWFWCEKDCAEITVTPQDGFGHIASPAKMPVPALEINGRAVRTEHGNDYSGTHRLKVRFESSHDKFIDRSGTFVTRRGVKIRLAEGERLTLNPNERFKASLKIGNQRLDVLIPEFVAARDSGEVRPAFDPKVLNIHPDHRIAFHDAVDVKNNGFKLNRE